MCVKPYAKLYVEPWFKTRPGVTDTENNVCTSVNRSSTCCSQVFFKDQGRGVWVDRPTSENALGWKKTPPVLWSPEGLNKKLMAL